MKNLAIGETSYYSALQPLSPLARRFPTLVFYWEFVANVLQSSRQSRRGTYKGEAWVRSCRKVLTDLERVGVRFEIEGLDHLDQLDSPCVIVANHMSVLETVVLPAVIRPFIDMTYILKQSLLDYPVFKHIVRSFDPIAVSRTNPRQDLKTVLEEGVDRLQKGMSVTVFPQTTRTTSFEPDKFNSIGVKLARRAAVPVVPLALVTDAWANGEFLKDFGKIDPTKTVRFSFGAPIAVNGGGGDQNQQIIHYIASKLDGWKESPAN